MSHAGVSLPLLRQQEDPRRPALRLGPEALNYGEFAARVVAVADVVAQVPPRGVVGICIGNEPALLVAFFGCLLARRAAVLLDPRWTAAERAWAESRIDAALLVHTGGEPRGAACRLDTAGRIANRPANVARGTQLEHDGVAVVHWSSGSTGRPKPIAVSRTALEHRVATLVPVFGLRPDDRMLGFVPLSHCHGLDCISLPTLAAGAEVILLEPLAATPERVVHEVGAWGVTAFSALPRFYAELLRANVAPGQLATVRLPLCGSAALDPAVAQAFARRFGRAIHNGYGLTEVGIVTLNRHEHEPVRFASVGRTLPGIEWRIDAPDARGTGELWVRSAALADGYPGDGAETARRFVDGWLKTEDLVAADADGYLTVVGRTSAFINVNGAKVDPSELEGLIASLPWVAECAVKGFVDAAGGECVVAFVVPRAEQEPKHAATLVQQHVAERVALFKVPKQVVLVPALPRSTLGKVLYAALPGPAGEPTDPYVAPADDLERAIAAHWQQILGLEAVGAEDAFVTLGGTSQQLLQLSEALSALGGRPLDLVLLFRHPTVRAQAALLRGAPLADPTAAARQRGRQQRAAEARRSKRAP